MIERVFKRANPDGSVQTVRVSWDPKTPSSTFSMEADGYKGSDCLNELSRLEGIIGAADMNLKPEAFNDEDNQDVFILGMQ